MEKIGLSRNYSAADIAKGRFVVVWRKEEKQIAKILEMRKNELLAHENTIRYELITGDKDEVGHEFMSIYDPSQEINIFDTIPEAAKAAGIGRNSLRKFLKLVKENKEKLAKKKAELDSLLKKPIDVFIDKKSVGIYKDVYTAVEVMKHALCSGAKEVEAKRRG